MSDLTRRNFLRLSLALPTPLAQQLAGSSSPGRKAPRAVVLGGGFSGLNAALTLKSLSPAWEVTVIESQKTHYRCPGSNAVIAGRTPMRQLQINAAPYLKAHGIHYRTGTGSKIDPLRRKLFLSDGTSLGYERLILAPGIGFHWNTLEGYDEAISHKLLHAWQAGPQTSMLRDQVRSMRPGGLFLMTVPAGPYRCPPGPYERVSLIASHFKKHNPRAKILILDAKTKFPKERAFRAAWSRLYPGMIEWLSFETEGQMERLDPKKREILTEFGRFRGDVLNIIPPQKAAPVAERFGLTDASGWCPVAPDTFKARDFDEIHVIGDAARYGAVPKSAFAAQAEGRLCALGIVLESLGQPIPKPRLINHCYSFVSGDEAISVTGIYEQKPESPAEMETLSVMESQPGDDLRREAAHAEDWMKLLVKSSFGSG